MKITTWNVNGIRAVFRKGSIQEAWNLDSDIYCLQEVKARQEQLSDEERNLPGYSCIWNPAEKAGYSGTAVYTRREPLEVIFGIGEEKFDREGRIIRMRFPGFWLFNVYFPSGQRGTERVGFKLEFYSSLLSLCDEMHRDNHQIIITGDFNTAHTEIDLANPRSNQKISGFLPEERAWVDKYLEHGFTDIFRARYPEKVQYTWWTYVSGARTRNVGWRLDYFLITHSLTNIVEDVTIHNEIDGSDHCPVSLLIRP